MELCPTPASAGANSFLDSESIIYRLRNTLNGNRPSWSFDPGPAQPPSRRKLSLRLTLAMSRARLPVHIIVVSPPRRTLQGLFTKLAILPPIFKVADSDSGPRGGWLFCLGNFVLPGLQDAVTMLTVPITNI